MDRLISIVISAFNEEASLRDFYDEISAVFDRAFAPSYELLFVDDGSTDSTASVLSELRMRDPSHVSVLSLSKNFGHEAAMTAGLDYAGGDIIIFMDADLQHPPALIPDIIARMDEGYDIVNMVRTDNASAGSLKNIGSLLFYRIVNLISDMHLTPQASDFFAIDERAAKVLRSNYRMKVRFMRGFVQNIGFKKSELEYAAPERVAGESHYSVGSLVRLSADVIFSSSELPLKLGIYLGLFTGLIGVALIIYTLVTRQGAPSGYATIVIAISFFAAATFMLLGIMGSYIALLFREIEDRPIYIVRDMERGASDESGDAEPGGLDESVE